MTNPRKLSQSPARSFDRARSLAAVVGRRLLVQAALSGTVMLGLQMASQIDLGLSAKLAGVDWSQLADAHTAPEQANRDAPTRPDVEASHPLDLVRTASLTPAPTTTVLAWPAAPAARTSRLPGPAGIDATRPQAAVTAEERPRPVTRARTQGAGTASAADVVRFDECQPLCESRDPLLLQTAMVTGGRDTATIAPVAERLVSVASPSTIPELGSQLSEPAPPLARGVVGTAVDGLVGARDVAASAVGRVAGLVGW
ncbi:hypothetical protein [Aureimonas sp. AU12]|uniref:hypothetical protein n=1 Tax=Aureimonas sp. AU12 TaxID=1638161 RepID=UPI0007803D30|nr:hypothetical protein [Aureimonas sp. AU12]